MLEEKNPTIIVTIENRTEQCKVSLKYSLLNKKLNTEACPGCHVLV